MKHVVRILTLPLTLLVACCLVVPGSGSAASAAPPFFEAWPSKVGIYESENGSGFGIFATEIVSMSLSSPPTYNPPLLPPIGGGMYDIDSFFDVFTELSIGGGGGSEIDSFFDVFTRLRIERADMGGTDTQTFATEIIAMSLSGFDGPPGIIIRESPTIASTGGHTITDLGGGMYDIDSFFDVFTELSLDGGGSWTPADRPIRMSYSVIVPEPTTLSLLGIGALAVLCLGGRAMWTRRGKSRTAE